MVDGEQKSTCAGVMSAIDSHIRSRSTYGEAKRDLETIRDHIGERLDHLAWYLGIVDQPQPDEIKESV